MLLFWTIQKAMKKKGKELYMVNAQMEPQKSTPVPQFYR